MTNAKHTTGRWIAVGAWVEHESDDVADICNCNPASMGQDHLGRTYEEICANANLIASAPYLFSALQKLVELADSNPFCPIGHAIEHIVPDYAQRIANTEGR